MNDSTNSPDNDNLDIFDFTDIETAVHYSSQLNDDQKLVYHAIMDIISKRTPIQLRPEQRKPAKRPKAKLKAKKQSALGYVYIFHSPTTGLYKIGRSTKPESRLYAVIEDGRHANPEFTANFVAYFLCHNDGKLEEILHEQFADKLSHKEWFKLSREDVVALIKSMLDGTHSSKWQAPTETDKEASAVFIDLSV